MATVAAVPIGGRRSQTQRTVTLSIYGDESQRLVLPVPVCQRVAAVKQTLSEALFVPADKITLVAKSGCSWRVQKDTDEVRYEVKVKGLSSFKPQPKVWPHPACIIGSGYHGLKTCMRYIKDGNTNFVCFDRNDRVGGYCWITGANATSKLQTEFGAFHLWWGPDFANLAGRCGDGLFDLQKWSAWPKKKEILEHFEYAAEQYGLHAYIQFRTNVAAMKIVGGEDAEERFYQLTVDSLDKPGQVRTVPVSLMYNYPGSLTTNRIIDYPGEDVFDGEIRYGMNDDTPYDKLPGSNVAILGNGAFAVENARTCIEAKANKVYLVTRRKNLASPRMPCWFVHQAPIMVPGHMVLKMFEPMYKLTGFGDPWAFWSVHTNKERTHVSIVQNSRFGIGDITFIAVAWGRLVYLQDTLKRCSHHTLHLTSGRKVEEVTIILKALGLLGDWAVDKLHSMKEMVGSFCSGDFRRVLMIDATGMNAANFETFSTGIGTHSFTATAKYFHDFPQEIYRATKDGLFQTLPRHAAEPEYDKPAYLTDVKFGGATGVTMGMFIPKAGGEAGPLIPAYWYEMYHAAHSWERTYKQCVEEWDEYQRKWREEEGWDHEYVPYPYTKEIMSSYFEEFNNLPSITEMGRQNNIDIKIRIEGPEPRQAPPGQVSSFTYFYDQK